MGSVKEWKLPMVERCWLQEELKAGKDLPFPVKKPISKNFWLSIRFWLKDDPPGLSFFLFENLI
jgi:hypothetical protein